MVISPDSPNKAKRRLPLLPLLALLVGLFGSLPALAEALPPVALSDRPFGSNNGRSVTGKIRVAATPHEAFLILADYPRMTEYVPGVEEATVLASRPGWARVRFRIRGGFFVSFTQIEERTTVADQTITWHATQGPLKVSDGSWTLEPAAKGTATDLIYHADLDPSMPIPASWMGSFVRQGVPEVLQSVRRRIESKGVWRLP